MLNNKIILLCLLIILSCKSVLQKSVFAEQLQIENKYNNEMLSKQEAELLNSLLKKSRDTFNFQVKKIAFVTGSSGSRIVSKIEYFHRCIDPWIQDGKTPHIFMVKLTKEEKEMSGGYDAFVLSWVKVFTDKQKRKTIHWLAKNNIP